MQATASPARRLRGLVDPSRLEPRLELQIDRVARIATRSWHLPGRVAFLYDRVSVRSGRLTREFQELKVRRLSPGRPHLEELARALEQAHQLRPSLQTKLARARTLLRQMGQESVIRDLDSGRAVAVIALDEGRVALLGHGGAPGLPVSPGSGEQAVRHGLAEWLGSKVADVVLLGRTPPTLEQPSLEVWLARRLRRGQSPPGAPAVEWMPMRELAHAVRTSTMRDPATLAAFAVAARSRLLPEWSLATDPAQATPASARETAPDLLDPTRSLVEFNVRVLAVAEDVRTPLLERLRYLAIVSANLDELYMASGGDVDEARVGELLARMQACIGDCLARLAEQGFPVRSWDHLTPEEREALKVRFRRELFPLLTPRAITQSPGHPFPVIPALTLSVAVALQDERTGPIHFAYLRLPSDLPRFVELPAAAGHVPVEQVVLANLAMLYPDRTIEEAGLFRVTRKGDLDIEESAAGDLLQALEEELDQRSVNPVVRLELQQGMSDLLRSMLVQELRFGGAHGVAASVADLVIHETAGLMAPGGLRDLTGLAVPGGLFPPFAGRDPFRPDIAVWDQVGARDRLVHHPYDDFSASVLRFLEEAAADPAVVAIKMTLYRAGERSPVVDALVRAARSGKRVAAFVELKASFDEARNIGWVKQLERAGAEVIYGLVGLKNHAKVALVVRREGQAIRQYAHFGTGNYNPGTARVYTDLGLFTVDPAMGDDLGDLFNQLTGTSGAPTAALRQVLVAPEHLLPGLLARIARESAHARAGRPAKIRAKLNGLDDPEVVRALYAASEAGVDVDLVVRGLCTLKPGVSGLSSRIRVRSLIGRFLEHARIYHFADGGADEYLIASADWRTRNLRRRVEVAAPVRDPACRRRLDRVLTQELADPSAWQLDPDGQYRQERSLPVGDPATAQAQAIAAAVPPEEEAVWAG